MTENSDTKLKSLSSRLIKLMKDSRTTNIDNLISKLMNNSSSADQKLVHDTTRRRIYDIINVLAATGIVSKIDKQLQWRGYPSPWLTLPIKTDSYFVDQEYYYKTLENVSILRHRFIYLSKLKLLIRRNLSFQKPSTVFHPDRFLLLKYQISNPIISVNEDSSEIRAKYPTFILSYMEIISQLQFQPELTTQIMQYSPLYQKIDELLKYFCCPL